MKKTFIYVVIMLVSAGVCYSQVTHSVETRLSEIIIKVNKDVISMPEGSYKAPVNDVKIESDELKALNKKFNLVSIEKMFAKKKPAGEIARKFTKREARAAEEASGSEKNNLENVFLFKFPEHIDTKKIVEEYEKIEDVVYAEENRSVSVLDL